ncbi:bacterial Ig-like domain-containing protein [Lactococcus lactis]|uniref:bacterial Ig-like domain-containing protein n=1 Tax=Lactococcus lactis TaxID=1358 RepID=UPI003877FB9F
MTKSSQSYAQVITTVPSWVGAYLTDSKGNEYYSGGSVLPLAVGTGIKNHFTLHANSNWTINDDDASVAIQPSSGNAGETTITITNLTTDDLGKGIELKETGVGGWTITTSQSPSKQNILAHDSTIYVGDTWEPKDNFDSATDSSGQNVEFSDNLSSGTVDTSTAGDYLITYTNGEDVFKEITVTVLDKPVVPKDVVVKYLDENNNIIHEEQRISGNIGDVYDASVSEYKLDILGYSLDENKLPENSKGKITDSEQVVTYVYKGTLGLSVPETLDFGSYKLGTSNSALTYPLNSPITVTNTTGKGWTLSASLEKSDSDFSNYLMNGSKKLSDNATLATSASVSDITTVVSSSWKEKTGLWVDYSTGNTVRDDSEVLVWTLTPDVETGVNE